MPESADLRAHVARSLHGRTDAVVKGAVEVSPPAGMEHVPADERARLTDLVLQLVIVAVRDRTLDRQHVMVSDIHHLAAERITMRAVFAVVDLVERSAIDVLALDSSFGLASNAWHEVTQVVRGASLDVYAALGGGATGTVIDTAVTDSLTTLHSSAVFVAALEKEVQRCERFGHPFALIVLDVDRLADINARHGYGAGDRILERLGIVLKNHFRTTDWVARLSKDMFAILLPEIQGEHAERLAERLRVTVEERLPLRDYRTDQQSPVTVSVALLVAESVGRTIKAEHLLTQAQALVERAKAEGGNRLERERITPLGA